MIRWVLTYTKPRNFPLYEAQMTKDIDGYEDPKSWCNRPFLWDSIILANGTTVKEAKQFNKGKWIVKDTRTEDEKINGKVIGGDPNDDRVTGLNNEEAERLDAGLDLI